MIYYEDSIIKLAGVNPTKFKVYATQLRLNRDDLHMLYSQILSDKRNGTFDYDLLEIMQTIIYQKKSLDIVERTPANRK